MPELTANAWIVGGRIRHHREHDHHGADYADFVVLSRRIGPYEEQTPLQFVFEDLAARIARVESTDIVRDSFTADAYISPWYILANAVIYAELAGSFVLDAFLNPAFKADAWIQGGGFLAADAVIVW